MRVPACKDLTQSKEKLVIPEIRVWCHPESGKDDYYKVFDSFLEAIKFISKHKEAEDIPLIAFRGYELNLWGMKKER